MKSGESVLPRRNIQVTRDLVGGGDKNRFSEREVRNKHWENREERNVK